jgi:DNA repair protein RecO (recombination protein O)
MEWSDEGIVLSVRPLGESSAVLSMLTRMHGRHAGLVRGGAGSRSRGALQPGSRLAARWRGRLADHLGTLACELAYSLAPAVLEDRRRLAAIASACAIAETALPEREPLPRVFAAFLALIEALEREPDWPADYVRWECRLLSELGYGLDLSRCALTGSADELAFVSPRTGRAVCAAAAEPWRERLLPLPAFLLDTEAPADQAALAAGLALTGRFLARCVYAEQGAALPPARLRLAAELAPGGTSLPRGGQP